MVNLDTIYLSLNELVSPKMAVVLGGYSIREHARRLLGDRALVSFPEIGTDDIDLKMGLKESCETFTLQDSRFAGLRDRFPSLQHVKKVVLRKGTEASAVKKPRVAFCEMWVSQELDIGLYSPMYGGMEMYATYCKTANVPFVTHDNDGQLMASLELTRFNAYHMLMLVLAAAYDRVVNQDNRNRIPKARKILLRALALSGMKISDLQTSEVQVSLRLLGDMGTSPDSVATSAFRTRLHKVLHRAFLPKQNPMFDFLWEYVYNALVRGEKTQRGGSGKQRALWDDLEDWFSVEEVKHPSHSLVYSTDTEAEAEVDRVLGDTLLSFLAANTALTQSPMTARLPAVHHTDHTLREVSVGAGRPRKKRNARKTARKDRKGRKKSRTKSRSRRLH